jgi:hypothetical protein
VAVLDTSIAVLGLLGRVLPPMADKAELARTGRFRARDTPSCGAL